MVPAVLRPFLLPFVLSLKDQRFSELLGYKYPNVFVRGFFKIAMWVRQQFNRMFTLWDVLDFEQLMFTKYRSYPNGYNPLRLGPTKFLKKLEKMEQVK